MAFVQAEYPPALTPWLLSVPVNPFRSSTPSIRSSTHTAVRPSSSYLA